MRQNTDVRIRVTPMLRVALQAASGSPPEARGRDGKLSTYVKGLIVNDLQQKGLWPREEQNDGEEQKRTA
jgi:hypothetical protein